MKKKYHALALFSGGLDSILAIKVIEQQGLSVLGLHFTSPFYGNAAKIEYWKQTYHLDLISVDLSEEAVTLLRQPRYGFGKHLNPCVDCKALMVRHGLDLLPIYGASFLISGEVIGQRPMSQRKDAMNSIKNMTAAHGRLLRPLCAFTQEPTLPEQNGLVDRERLPRISGRDRKIQMEMAQDFGVTEIPNPGGGCLLTEPETAKRYAPVLTHFPSPTPQDFLLTGLGRQFWHDSFWLTIGRNRIDNEQLLKVAQKRDICFRLEKHPGPIGLLRFQHTEISEKVMEEAARITAWFAPKARGQQVGVYANTENAQQIFQVLPEKTIFWQEPDLAGISAYKQL